jgi:preprotein translocase subunit SecB
MPTTTEKKAKPTYAEFIGSLQLNTIYLREAACEIDRDSFWQNQDQKITYDLSASPTKIDDDYFDASATLVVNVVGEKSKTKLIKISAKYDFHVHTKLASKEFIEKFCGSEVRLIIWPYFREYVSETSSRMYIPPIILPLSDKAEK